MKFKNIAFVDVLEKIIDNRGRTCPVEENGIPLIATNCVKNETLYPSFEKVRYVSQKTYDNWFRGHPEPNDIIFVLKGSPGRVNWVPDPVNFCIAQDMVAIRANRKIVDSKYLFALLRSRQVQVQIENMHVGSLIPHFKKGDFDKLILPILEDLNIQRKIGDIYFSFNNKIELNRKMNQTLEEMAQALFKSWFVDFDPVHAKADAKSDEALESAATELGISKEVLELFPGEFEESEMGMIPKGWEVKSLDKIAHYQNGLALQKFRPKDENHFLPVLKIAQLKKGYADGEEKADIGIKPACIVDSGDVVFSWSGSLVVDVWCGGKVALNQHLFKVTSDDYAKWFYYYWTKQHLANFQRVAAAKAVTMGHIKRSHLAEALCVVPDHIIFKIAEKMISPLLEKLILNRLEVNNLQKTRDTLLPKLLSGELNVSNLK